MSRPAPVHLLAGGPGSRRSGSDPLLAEVFAASGKARPTVAYVGAASGDNQAFYAMLAARMKGSGAGRVAPVRLCGRTPDAERARRELEAADVVFLSGGDVEAGMAVLERTGMVPVLERLHRDGRPFFGLSAGSIMLAARWVRWDDPDDDSTIGLFPCLGFAQVLVDTHGEADGWSELVALLGLEKKGAVGYGIPTGAGVRVGSDGAVAALGGPVHRFARRCGGVERIADLVPA